MLEVLNDVLLVLGFCSKAEILQTSIEIEYPYIIKVY